MKSNAHTTNTMFSRTTVISDTIAAEPEKVWHILTNASEYARWNSTIISLEGDITQNGHIQLISTLDPSRTFRLTVKEFQPRRLLVWGDFLGSRMFTIKPDGNCSKLTILEKIGGPLFPLFASNIPSFDESFNAFMRDLKKEAEQ